MTARTEIATWIVIDSEQDATFFPQVGSRSDAAAAQLIYWRCAFVFFACSVYLNPNSKHVFYTNAQLPVLNGIDIRAVFQEWNVKVVYLEINHRLPKGQINSWGNQFYILDILNYISEHGSSDRYLVLDSDCIFRRGVGEIENEIDRCGVLTYAVYGHSFGHDVALNGRTLRDLESFQLTHFGEMPAVTYCGGEFFAATLDEVRRVREVASQYWDIAISGVPNFPREEAQLLSLVYNHLGYGMGTADQFIKRIWTGFGDRNVSPTDTELWLWHLPSEKLTGFQRCFRTLANNICDGAPALPQPWSDFSSRIFGVPKVSFLKRVDDARVLGSKKIRTFIDGL